MTMILLSSLIRKIKPETINDLYHRKTSSYFECIATFKYLYLLHIKRNKIYKIMLSPV